MGLASRVLNAMAFSDLLTMSLSIPVLLIQGMLLSVVAPEFLASGQSRNNFTILSLVSVAAMGFLCGSAIVRAFRRAFATATWTWPTKNVHQHPVWEEHLFALDSEELFLMIYPALASVMYSIGARISIFRRGLGEDRSSGSTS